MTQQQLAATTGSNHEVVITTLHQVLQDAMQQQQQAQQAQGQQQQHDQLTPSNGASGSPPPRALAKGSQGGGGAAAAAALGSSPPPPGAGGAATESSMFLGGGYACGSPDAVGHSFGSGEKHKCRDGLWWGRTKGGSVCSVRPPSASHLVDSPLSLASHGNRSPLAPAAPSAPSSLGGSLPPFMPHHQWQQQQHDQELQCNLWQPHQQQRATLTNAGPAGIAGGNPDA